eukprot:6461976-Amphidinium_carterae.1
MVSNNEHTGSAAASGSKPLSSLGPGSGPGSVEVTGVTQEGHDNHSSATSKESTNQAKTAADGDMEACTTMKWQASATQQHQNAQTKGHATCLCLGHT